VGTSNQKQAKVPAGGWTYEQLMAVVITPALVEPGLILTLREKTGTDASDTVMMVDGAAGTMVKQTKGVMLAGLNKEINTASSRGAGVGFTAPKDGVNLPFYSLRVASPHLTAELNPVTLSIDMTLVEPPPLILVGATAGTPGVAGLAPAPLKTQQTLFLCGDGTWANPAVFAAAVDGRRQVRWLAPLAWMVSLALRRRPRSAAFGCAVTVHGA
jgi:hypothetical protein